MYIEWVAEEGRLMPLKLLTSSCSDVRGGGGSTAVGGCPWCQCRGVA